MSDPSQKPEHEASKDGDKKIPRDRSNLKERLQKLRLQKTEQGLDGGETIAKTPKTPMAASTPTNPEDRKKLLQRLRESRTNLEASRRSMDKLSEDGSEAGQSVDSFNERQMYQDPIFEEEELTQIHGVEYPKKVFDLNFYELFSREKAIGEHLILPAAKPNVAYNLDKFTLHAIGCCSYFCGYCFPNCPDASHQVIATEQELILNRKKRKIVNVPFDIENQALTEEQLNWYYEGLEDDGVFQDFLPLLAPVLLSSETVPPAIAQFTGPHVYLSRVTQRLLRELTNLQKKSAALAAADARGQQVSSEGDDKRGGRRGQRKIFEEISLNKYLNWRNSNLCFNLIRNPLDFSLNRFTISSVYNSPAPVTSAPSSSSSSSAPLPALYYGGKIGQWPVDALPVQRFGPLPNSFQHHASQGSLLKLFVLHLSLADHPLMNVEERHAVQLRELWTSYCQIFDEKLVEFHALQMHHLLADLSQFLEKFPAPPQDEESYAELHRCYEKIVETLPELQNLSSRIHQLTSRIYNQWRDIKEFRRRQTFVTTAVAVRIKRLRSNLSAGGGRRKKESVAAATQSNDFATPRPDTARTTGSAIHSLTEWTAFAGQLERLPAQLKALRQLLSAKREKAEGQEEEEEQKEAEDPFYAANQQKTPEEWERELSAVEAAAQELRGSSGLLPAFLLQLSENPQQITSDINLPAHEIKRREKIRSTRFKLVVRLNGQVASSTYYQFVRYPEFLVDFRCYLEMKVLRMPSDISVYIYSKGKRSTRSKELGHIRLPAPGALTTSSLVKATLSGRRGLFSKGSVGGGGSSGGHHAIHTHANSTAYGGYEFTSDILRHRSHYHRPHAASLFSLDRCLQCCCGDDFEYSQRMVATLFCALEFDPVVPHGEVNVSNSVNNKLLQVEGVDTAELAVYPSLETAAQSTPSSSSGASASFLSSLLSDFTRENDFQRLLPNLAELDANDPLNDYLLYLKSKRLSAVSGDYFRLGGLDYAVPFLSLLFQEAVRDGRDENALRLLNELNGRKVTLLNFAKLRPNARLQLLRLRTKKPFLFYGLAIPLLPEKIKENEQLKTLLQQEVIGPNSPAHPLTPGGGQASEPTEAQLLGKESVNLAKATNFLQRVRNSYTVTSRRVTKKKLKTASVVLEVNFIPRLDFLPLLLSALFARRRELKPKKKDRSPEVAVINACDLLVQVVGAKNIPLRIDFSPFGRDGPEAMAMSGRFSGPGRGGGGGVLSSPARGGGGALLTDAPSSPGPGLGHVGRLTLNEFKLRERRRVHSFIEVKFQDQVIATTTFQGTTPMWKESLSLPFLPPKNDFSPIGLDQLREEVFFTLFDEVIEDDRDRGGFLEGESTIRVERYYLGSFSIPFNALYHEGKIEGIFRLDTPLFNFGYEKRATSTAFLTDGGAGGGPAGSVPLLSSSTAGGIPRTGSQESLNGLLATSQDEAERGLANPNASPGTAAPGGGGGALESPRLDKVPTNHVISTTASFFAMASLFLVYCLDCCPDIKAWLEKIYAVLAWPFRSVPFSGYYNNLFLRSNHLLPETGRELAAFASDDSTSYLKVMLTFDPLLPVTRTAADEVSPSTVIPDDRLIAIHASRFLETVKELNEHTAARPYKLFAMNSSGLQVFLCRFLTSQQPPPGFQSRRAAIHLVSLLPFVKDIQSFIGEMDLWCSNAQFWEIGAGDEEEHAVLLYAYLRYFKNLDGGNKNNLDGGRGGRGALTQQSGRGLSSFFGLSSLLSRSAAGSNYPSEDFVRRESVFLALGKAFPEGETVYLLVRDWNRQAAAAQLLDGPDFDPAAYYAPEHYLVINPWTGHVYSAVDPYCPLKAIHTLATPYNLWLNVQAAEAPGALDYNILDSSRWRSFFNGHFPPLAGGLTTIQQEIDYQPTDPAYCETIERTVFQAIRNSLRRWRSKRQRPTTTFHPEASNVMLELLPRLEAWKRDGDFHPEQRARLLSRDGRVQFSSATQSQPSQAGGEASPGLEALQEEVRRRLQPILRTRVLRGFPVNLPFTDVDEVLAHVKTFCVHENNHPEVQFVLAVKALPLFNGTVSLWLFLGTLEVMASGR